MTNKTTVTIAIVTVLIAGAMTIQPAVAGIESLNFRWHPDDASSDPNNLIVISGSFTRQGLTSETTTDVQGEVEGALVGTTKDTSETSVTNTAGSTTITTEVISQKRNVNNVQGQITIDGEVFTAHLRTPGYDAVQLLLTQEFTSPTSTRTLNQEVLRIPVIITLSNADNSKVLQGFGTIARESSTTTVGTTTVTFATDKLEASVIGESGLFELNLSKLQRTVS